MWLKWQSICLTSMKPWILHKTDEWEQILLNNYTFFIVTCIFKKKNLHTHTHTHTHTHKFLALGIKPKALCMLRQALYHLSYIPSPAWVTFKTNNPCVANMLSKCDTWLCHTGFVDALVPTSGLSRWLVPCLWAGSTSCATVSTIPFLLLSFFGSLEPGPSADVAQRGG
jgi:hypothetical protein